ncbi:MAG TPA: tetratricopeptide repeat protein [Chloroflexota bacterium]|nr:tetratricopeptide repeat protein [Chloroflexota bacterium]
MTTTFGALLRRYRLTASLSQEALAERAGLSVGAIGALEGGRRTSPHPETVSLLADALGLSPADRAALIAAVGVREPAATVIPGMPAPPSALPATALPTWPVPPTVLIGREREEAAVVHLLRREERGNLVTLTGPGGVGKTRLALTVATVLRDAYPDGVTFVDLSALRDPALVAPTVAQALGLRGEGARGARDLLLMSLRERKLLLVLDNFEQVVEAASLLGELTAACPHLSVLVTSRIALRVRAEQRFAVSPLDVPDARDPGVEEVENCAAVRLFVTRARAAQPNFSLNAANVAAVTEICRRLDGLPLAIELAAARIVVLPPAALLERLERRLGMLTRGARDLPARQQTLRATIDWDYALLTAEEQMLFRRLAVFGTGGGTLEAIEAICDPDGALDAFGAVASLVDKSLLRPARGDEPRVGMLETLREYAGERLDAAAETARLRQAHAAYFLALAETAEPRLRGAEQAEWLKRLEDEHDNLRAALQWSLQPGEAEIGLRLGAALWRFWYMHGYAAEGRRWLAQLLALPDGGAQGSLAGARANVLGGAGTFAELQGDLAGARTLLEESLAISRDLEDTPGIAACLNALGVVADSQGDLPRATALYTESLALCRELGDSWGTALVLSNMGYLAREQGAHTQAATLYAESVALFREGGDRRSIAFTLNNLGDVVCDQGDYMRATALCEESLALRRALGDTWGIAISLTSLGYVAQAQGDYARATTLDEESLALFRNLGATWNTACTLDSLSNVARKQGAYARAALLGEQSLARFREIQDDKGIARALTTLGQVARAQGERARAERLFRESLALYRARGPIIGVVACLEGLAQVLCASGELPSGDGMERAVQLLAATAALREAQGTPLPAVDQAAYDQTIAMARESLGEQALAMACSRGAALSLEQAIALGSL